MNAIYVSNAIFTLLEEEGTSITNIRYKSNIIAYSYNFRHLNDDEKTIEENINLANMYQAKGRDILMGPYLVHDNTYYIITNYLFGLDNKVIFDCIDIYTKNKISFKVSPKQSNLKMFNDNDLLEFTNVIINKKENNNTTFYDKENNIIEFQLCNPS
jgi:hypothetical protein